jgi:hypothetical protein
VKQNFRHHIVALGTTNCHFYVDSESQPFQRVYQSLDAADPSWGGIQSNLWVSGEEFRDRFEGDVVQIPEEYSTGAGAVNIDDYLQVVFQSGQFEVQVPPKRARSFLDGISCCFAPRAVGK